MICNKKDNNFKQIFSFQIRIQIECDDVIVLLGDKRPIFLFITFAMAYQNFKFINAETSHFYQLLGPITHYIATRICLLTIISCPPHSLLNIIALTNVVMISETPSVASTYPLRSFLFWVWLRAQPSSQQGQALSTITIW